MPEKIEYEIVKRIVRERPQYVLKLVIKPENYRAICVYRTEEAAMADVEHKKQELMMSFIEYKQKLLDRYSALKPSEIRYSVDDNGDGYYYCELDSSVFGEKKLIKGKSIEDLRTALEIELDKLVIVGKANYPPLKYSAKVKRIVSCMNDDDKQKFAELLTFILVGTETESKYAVEQLRKMFFLGRYSNSAKTRDKIKKKKLECSKKRVGFYETLHQVIDVENIFSANKLANIVGCTPATVSRIRSGKIKPKKELVIRFAIALNISLEDITSFVRSAGYNFPTDKKDLIILNCLKNGVCDYNGIREALVKYDPNFDI